MGENQDDLPVVNAAIADQMRVLGMDAKAVQSALGLRAAQTVYKWLSGETTPPASRWTAIEDVLVMRRGTLARLAGLVDDAPVDDDELRALVLARLDDLAVQMADLRALVLGRHASVTTGPK